MDMYIEANEYVTTIKYLPVCERCGYIFREGIQLKEEIIETGLGFKYPERSIVPSICPKCKRHIECAKWCDPRKER
jgi:predicted Zn-ribbon and HTH transcriptional regulator